MRPEAAGAKPDAVAIGGPERCSDNGAEQPAVPRADQRAGARAHDRAERAAQLCAVGEAGSAAELGSHAERNGAGAVDVEPGRDFGADAVGSAVVERDAEPGSGSDAGSQHAAR